MFGGCLIEMFRLIDIVLRAGFHDMRRSGRFGKMTRNMYVGFCLHGMHGVVGLNGPCGGSNLLGLGRL